MLKVAAKGKNLAIVIPTFNESINLKILISKIKKNLPLAMIIIVDDSFAAENKKIKKYFLKEKNVVLISRLKKLGRGSAVMRGFYEAIKIKKIKYFIEMDSDLAHDPQEIIKFIKKNHKNNFDLIIGSRYIKKGRSEVSKTRIILSRIINFFLKLWLNIDITDFTSGFRFYNRRALTFLLKEKLRSTGFITLSEIVYKLSRHRFKIGEVPITVHQRKHGKSTFGLKELGDSLFFILRLRFQR